VQQGGELVALHRDAGKGACFSLGSAMADALRRGLLEGEWMLGSSVDRGQDSSAGLALAQRLQQRRVLQDLGDQLLGAGLAVHVGHQVRQLVARLEQLLERRRPWRRRRPGEKSSMLSKVMSTDRLPSPVSVLGT
jgi:hypothetical protein